jgi:hypothetical protein
MCKTCTSRRAYAFATSDHPFRAARHVTTPGDFALADYAFDIDAVPQGYQYTAARLAVFTPLFGPWRGRRIADLLATTQKRYRSRLSRYHELLNQEQDRNELLVHERELQYARNCPPFGASLSRWAQPCNRQLICPFCWARRTVYEVYLRLEAMLFVPPEPPEAPGAEAAAAADAAWRLRVPPESHLVHVVETRRLHNKEHPEVWNVDWVDRAVDVALQVTRDPRERRYGLHGLGPTLGSMVLHTFSPTKSDLVFRRHTLALVPQPAVLPTFARPPWMIVRSQKPASRANLAQLVGRACAFPPGMLSGDPAYALAVFRRLRRVRTLAFRKPQADPAGDEDV